MNKPSAIAALCLAALTACSKPATVARVGARAPDWTMPTSAGQTLELSSLRGKAVYLNFFASWCTPCNAEAPDINALQKRYASRGLAVVGIDELEGRAKTAGFAKKYGLVYPTIVDSGLLQTQYAINGLPVHVFIARDGTIQKIRVGEMTHTEIDAAIRTIL
ncbi:MAG TPA: TlpA disulfide reductase family protein [Candidatus Baltobacteraceae bacterium]|jgi:peroxiredoxin